MTSHFQAELEKNARLMILLTLSDPFQKDVIVYCKRSLLFKREPGFVTPGFATYAEVRKFWNYPDNAKLEVRVKQTYDVVEM